MSAEHTDEMMLPIFTKDTNGSPMKRHVSTLPSDPYTGLFLDPCYYKMTCARDIYTFGADDQFVQPRRNYAIVQYQPQTGDLEFDIRVEKEQGGGVTVS